jgi:HD-GYP domain-containing protein (c-di-GMP phosphodiesterase class II)
MYQERETGKIKLWKDTGINIAGADKKLDNEKDATYFFDPTLEEIPHMNSQVGTMVSNAMEDSIGYTKTKEETRGLLDYIYANETVQEDTAHSVSEELTNKLEEHKASKILSLINALAPIDEYLYRHSMNVGLLNGLMGKWINMSADEVYNLVLIGLLHDCGKALVPSQVLNATRRLTAVEYEVMKMHTIYSYDLLSDFPSTVRVAARSHHEKTNGLGYPYKFAGEEIPLEARITAISDIYDAMVSQRSYKKAQSPFEVLDELSKLKGTELDPDLVELYIRNMPKELIGKEVVMSNGNIGVVHSVNYDNIKYPTIIFGGREINSNEYWYCTHMHLSDDNDIQSGNFTSILEKI